MTSDAGEKLERAYNQMMERLHHAFESAEAKTMPTIRHGIEKAREKAVDLEELTHEEAEKVAYYVKRDLQGVGKHLDEDKNELGGWLRFDIAQVEDRLLEIFTSVADKTRLGMLDLQHELEEDPPYHAGEITSPGTLYCDQCNEALILHHIAKIPTCKKCGSENFRRWPHGSSPSKISE